MILSRKLELWPNVIGLHFPLFFLSLVFHYKLINRVSLLISIALLLAYNFRDLKYILKKIYFNSRHFYGFLFLQFWGVINITWAYTPKETSVAVFNQLAIFTFSILSVNYFRNKVSFNENLKYSAIAIVSISALYTIFYHDQSTSSLGLKSLFAHKNALGFAMSISILSIYLSSKKTILDPVFIGTAFILLYLSQSKTSMYLMLSIIFALIVGKYMLTKYLQSSEYIRGFYVICLKFICVLLYLGVSLLVIFHDSIVSYLIDNIPGELFTGRGEIWRTVLYRVGDHLLIGIGSNSFWGAGIYSEVIQMNSWLSHMMSSDGGYTDIVVSMGVIGLAALLVSLIQSVQSIPRVKERTDIPLCIALIAFFAIHNITETDVYQTGNSVWFLFVYLNAYMMLSSDDKSKKNQIRHVDISN